MGIKLLLLLGGNSSFLSVPVGHLQICPQWPLRPPALYERGLHFPDVPVCHSRACSADELLVEDQKLEIQG